MTPRIAKKESFTVVGLAGKFTMQNNTIPQLWDQFNRRAAEIMNADCTACLGVCYFEPDYKEDTSFTYMAGMIVNSIDVIPDGMTHRTLPASNYAVFEHKGALDTLQKTYDHIFREWLPASEYEMAKQDDFELYDDRFVYGSPDSIMEIWIPIQKR